MRNILIRALTIKACTAAISAAVFFGGTAASQTKKPKPSPNKPAEESAQSAQAVPEPVPTPVKRNERPGQNVSAGEGNASKNPAAKPTFDHDYRYEFSQPEFVVSHVRIEHDAKGIGTISFKKKGSDEPITDPVTISPVSLERINNALAALKFLESTEDYQYEKDYSHLGVTKFAFTQNGRSRETVFNWTVNKDAKTLMDEYRKIGNQYIWVFDISLSRENQPLDAPRLFDSLDSMIRRNEISDPLQMEPFLRELSNDERIPLIARNHAARLVTQFEKEKKKSSK